jgi:modulator of FtsH protease HflK
MADNSPIKLGPGPGGRALGADDAQSQALSEALGSSVAIVRVMMALLVAALIFSCVFTVNPNEVAVVLRFGSPRGVGSESVLHQGLHWALPYPIDEIVRIPVGESRTVRATNAWFATSPELEATHTLPPAQGTLSPGVDGAVITADGNLMHVRSTLKYQIADPVAYTFRFYDATNLLVNALNNAIYWAGSRYTAAYALTNQAEFNAAVTGRLQDQVRKAGLGVKLEPLNVEVMAPLSVKESFDKVAQAEQNKSTLINQAQGYADETVRKAAGEAAAVRAAGMVASNAIVQGVSSEARFFTNQIAGFASNPDLYFERKRLEVFGQVLTNAAGIFYLPDRADAVPRELRLQLTREPKEPQKKDGLSR